MRRRTRETRGLAVSALVALAIALPLTAPSLIATVSSAASETLPGADFRGVPRVNTNAESTAATLTNPSERSPKLSARSRVLELVGDLSAGRVLLAVVLAALAFIAVGSAPNIESAARPSAPRAPPLLLQRG